MKIKKNIAISDEGFLFNPSTGDSFSTNGIGSDIISLLKKGQSLPEITDEICMKYDVDSILFERDLDEFSSVLKEFNLLE